MSLGELFSGPKQICKAQSLRLREFADDFKNKKEGHEPLRSNLVRYVVLLCTTLTLQGCRQLPPKPAYGYTPLSPVPASLTTFGLICESSTNLLDELPNESMHLSIAQLNTDSKVTYGPSAVSAANSDYKVVLDYIKSATKPFRITINKGPEGKHTNSDDSPKYIAVYAGVGFRIEANIHSKKAGINLGNLASIGVAADAHDITGQLSIQLLGLSGPEITSALPIPTDISSATIQSTLVGMGAIKSKLYDVGTKKTPQVVGVENLYGEDIVGLSGYVSSLLATAHQDASVVTADLYFGNGALQGTNVVTIYRFWTPSADTKYDMFPNLERGKIDQELLKETPWYWVDDADQRVKDFAKKLVAEGVLAYDYFHSFGKGTTDPKRGYTWEIPVVKQHPISREQFVKIYSEFWGRKTNIWLETFRVSSAHERPQSTN